MPSTLLTAVLRMRGLWLLAALLSPGVMLSQTDYYNLDGGRPLRVEDALVIEHRALELQLAPLRFTGGGRGTHVAIAVEPEMSWGVLPRTQLEVGVPLARAGTANRAVGAAGVHVSVLHALNTETLGWPGLAVRAAVVLPAGALGPTRPLLTLGALATRTLPKARVHVNASVTPGRAGGRVGDDAARWRVGLAADRTLVMHSMLVGAELVAEEPLGGAAVVWSAGVGTRYQVGPRTAFDAGVGRRVTGNGEWFVTLGSAISLGIPHRRGGAQ